MIFNKLTARKVCRKQKTTMFNISPEMNWTVYESIILSKIYFLLFVPAPGYRGRTGESFLGEYSTVFLHKSGNFGLWETDRNVSQHMY